MVFQNMGLFLKKLLLILEKIIFLILKNNLTLSILKLLLLFSNFLFKSSIFLGKNFCYDLIYTLFIKIYITFHNI